MNKETLYETVIKTYNGIEISYIEEYYLDYEVDENTGVINKEKIVKYYTKNQINQNLKNFKEAINNIN